MEPVSNLLVILQSILFMVVKNSNYNNYYVMNKLINFFFVKQQTKYVVIQ